MPDNAIQSRGVPRARAVQAKTGWNPNPRRRFDPRITYPKQEDSHAIQACYFGPPQMQPAPGASSEGNVGPGATATGTKMKSHKMKSLRMKSSKVKSGTTTGMSAGARKGEARNPAGQGSAGTGSDDNAAKKGGSK